MATAAYKAYQKYKDRYEAEAIANSFNWNFEEPESGDDADPPAAAIGVFDKIGDIGSPKPAGSSEPPATVAGGKRKARA